VSQLFVVGISWRTAPVAVREKLAFREEELATTLQAMTKSLPVAEALLISTCNRVEIYGVGHAGQDPTGEVRKFIAEQRGLAPAEVSDVLYDHTGPAAIRHVFRSRARSTRSCSARRRSSGSSRRPMASPAAQGPRARCSGAASSARSASRSECAPTETAIARGAAKVSTVAVDLAARVFNLAGKTVLVVGAARCRRSRPGT